MLGLESLTEMEEHMKVSILSLVVSSALIASAQAQDSAISVLKTAGKQSAARNQAAMKEIVAAGSKGLLPVLASFKGADPVGANWLRAAFESSASRIQNSGGRLPGELASFVEDKNRKYDGRARRLAFDWMVKEDAGMREKMIPAMLFDPFPDFRRDAIGLLIDEGSKQLKAGKKDAAKSTFEKALSAAIHDDQVKLIMKPLKELGREVDLQRHFGFLPEWSLVGPFGNKEGVGFAEVYAPEKKLDLKSELDGEIGKVKWAKFSTKDDYGTINIAKLVKNYKGSCMYATTEFHADKDREVEFRMATPNAWKLWVNGKHVFGREEYHRTPSNLVMDVYRVPVKLKAGANRILLKVCQNEQEQDWAQRYQFNVRICDESGVAVRPVTKTASLR